VTIELPGWLEWLADTTVGHFPEGDEDALRRMRDAYTAAAEAVRVAANDGDATASRVDGTIEGWTRTAFDDYWQTFTGGSDAYLPSLAQLCTELASACDATALDLEYTKLSVIAALVALAAEVAALVASAFFDFGASAAAIEPAEAATAGVVRTLVTALVRSIVQHVVINVVIDAAIQTVQIAEGNRHGYDVGKIGHDAATGAIAGIASAGAGGLLSKVGGHVLGEDAGKLATAAVKGGVGVVSGAAEETVVVGVDQGRLPTPEELLRGGVQGGVHEAQSGLHERGEDIGRTNAQAPPGRHEAPPEGSAPAPPAPAATAPAPAPAPARAPAAAAPPHGRHESTAPGPDQRIADGPSSNPNRVEDVTPGEVAAPEEPGKIPVLNLP
jgi:hypothetical protein